MVQDILKAYRQKIEEQEARHLHPKAAFSKEHSRFFGPEEDHRLPYKRDVDRIVHSKAYARYVDKTQVAYLIHNDHVAQRSLHVQLVSNFARGIAEILELNLDLVEAISLGHDVGHPPFGHEGEGYLSKLSQEYGNGIFSHPWQSCRLFSEVEPLNLGLAVYDGFLCHDGGGRSFVHTPHFDKTWDLHLSDLKIKLSEEEKDITPGTLEGCLVKLCDTMSYIGRDIEDAILLGLIKRGDVPKTYLGVTNREILSHLAQDIIQNSYEKDFIASSEEAFHALKILRNFNFERIYTHPKLKGESIKIERSYRILFEMLLTDYENLKENSHLWTAFVHSKADDYKEKTAPVTMVVDYISGMTDRYFIRTLKQFVVPEQIKL